MGNSTHILHRVESAIANLYITSSMSGTLSSSYASASVLSVFTGEGNDEKNAPCIICSCNAARIEIPYTGVWRVSATIKVKEMAADTNTSNIGSLADLVYEIFEDPNTDIGAYNTSQSGSLGIIQTILMDQSVNHINDCWVQEIKSDIICFG